MNDKARELLVKAALDGVPQCRGFLFMGDAQCALGVIASGLGLKQAYQKGLNMTKWWEMFYAMSGVTPEERDKIVEANDHKGWDFLQIARKIGVNHE